MPLRKGTDAAWCNPATYVKSEKTRPAVPPNANAVKVMGQLSTEYALREQVFAYLDCINGVSNSVLVSCPVNATADYMMDALFGLGKASLSLFSSSFCHNLLSPPCFSTD